MAWGVAPEAQRPALGAHASTSGDPGLAPEAAVRLLRDLLAAFFQAYLEDASEVRKPQMSRLLAQAHQHGLVGAGVLPALAALHDSLRPELDSGPEKFAAFYHFIFFVARERGHRNLNADAATRAWAFALANGRFTLLERFCLFVQSRDLPRGVSEDTWCQVLDFANAARAYATPDAVVAAYDPRGAWPVLVDEFVDHLKGDCLLDFSSQSMTQSASMTTSMATNSENDKEPNFVGSPQEDRWRVAGWANRDRDSGFSPPNAFDSAIDRAARAVYTGGGAGGAGQGFGRYDLAGSNAGGGSLTGVGAAANPEWGGGDVAARSAAGAAGAAAEHRLHFPAQQVAVGCKRRLSAVLEMDGLATQLERQARVESPAFGASANGDDGRSTFRGVPNGDGGNFPNPVTGSPTRKFARGASESIARRRT
jgi:DCN1-like protein 1/2